jgi:hypothetical protein
MSVNIDDLLRQSLSKREEKTHPLAAIFLARRALPPISE